MFLPCCILPQTLTFYFPFFSCIISDSSRSWQICLASLASPRCTTGSGLTLSSWLGLELACSKYHQLITGSVEMNKALHRNHPPCLLPATWSSFCCNLSCILFIRLFSVGDNTPGGLRDQEVQHRHHHGHLIVRSLAVTQKTPQLSEWREFRQIIETL